jgi:hypothetical protein
MKINKRLVENGGMFHNRDMNTTTTETEIETKLTKLEQFAYANSELSPLEMAGQLCRTERAMIRVLNSMERKLRDAEHN